jgi:hypothetical protein
MDDDIDTSNGIGETCAGQHIALHGARARGKGGGYAPRQHPDLVALRDQPGYELAAQRSGATGDQYVRHDSGGYARLTRRRAGL